MSSRRSRGLVGALLALTAVLALAVPAQAGHHHHKAQLKRGATTLALDPATARALTDLGVTVSPLAPARARDAGIAFPVTGGRLDPDTYAGRIRHSGGLALNAGDTGVRVRNFVIRIDESPDLTAKVVGGPRISLLDLDLSGAEIERRGKRLTVAGVAATLSVDGAAALNGVFGTAFEEGLAIGTATVKTKLQRNRRG